LTYIVAYGVNVVFWDEWNFVPLVQNSMIGRLTFAQLWAPHNEARIFFPNLVAIVLARISRWNDFVFFFFSAALVAATVIAILMVCRKAVKRAPLWFVFVPLIAFSLVQFENTLWAFQICWFMVLFGVVGALAILASERPVTKTRLAIAAALGIVASYSLLQGLLVWPVGLVLLSVKGRPRWARIAWPVIGVVSTLLYLIGYSNADAGVLPLRSYFYHIPVTFQALLLTIGNIIPNAHLDVAFPSVSLVIGPTYLDQEILGAVILAAGLAGIARWCWLGRPGGAEAMAIGLVMTGIVFDLMLIPARLYNNLAGGLPSRYTTMTLPLLIGVYLVGLLARKSGEPWNRRSIALRAGMLLLVCLQVTFGTISGIGNGETNAASSRTSADVLANLSTASTLEIEPYLFPPTPSYVKEYAPFLEKNGMNVFSGGTVTALRHLGIVPGGQATPRLREPAPVQPWTRDDVTAKRAWTVLSAVYSTNTFALAPYATGAAGTAGIVDWAAVQPRVVVGTISPWYAPPAIVFLQAYTRFYLAWQTQLTWTSRTTSSLPEPPAIRGYLHAHPEAQLAWGVLSGTYNNSTSLQKHYARSQGLALIRWAASVGSLPAGQMPALVPLHREYLTIANLLQKATDTASSTASS